MRYTAGLALSVASIFLAVVALLLNSGGLFYMGTALVATIIAARVQALLAVKGLKLQRIVPQSAGVGEVVSITLMVSSGRKINRPLVFLSDRLPSRLRGRIVQPALAIAPAYSRAISTSYSFRPLKRGIFTWSKIHVSSSDALGLARASTDYDLPEAKLSVYPVPVAFDVPISFGGGIGIEGARHSKYAHSGVNVRGIRSYERGDPLRHIHWKSTARRDQLMVKQFDSDTTLHAAILIQDTSGSDVAGQDGSTLESACCHAMFLVERLLSSGAMVSLPKYEESRNHSRQTNEERLLAVRSFLAEVEANRSTTISLDLLEGINQAQFGQFYIFMSIQDAQLPAMIQRLPPGSVTVFLYDPTIYRSTLASSSSAASQDYRHQLERCGASVFELPPVRFGA